MTDATQIQPTTNEAPKTQVPDPLDMLMLRVAKLEASMQAPSNEKLDAALNAIGKVEDMGRTHEARIVAIEQRPQVVIDKEQVDAALSVHPDIARFRNFLDRHNL